MSIKRKLKQSGTKFRIAVGLVSITVTLMLLGAFLGLTPSEHSLQLQKRAAIAEVIAVNGTLLITQKDVRRMQALLTKVVEKYEDIEYAEIGLADGKVVVEVGERVSSDLQRLSVPVWQNQEQWGQVALYFRPIYPPGIVGFVHQPLVQFILFVSVISFIFFFFYLGRMLKLLDPSQAIPDRVRSALDTMAEGLLVLDAKQNIVLANQAFSHIVQKSAQELVGANCRNFTWLNTDGSEFVAQRSPWGEALSQSKAVTSRRVRLQIDNDHLYTFMVNCSPVLANSGKAGGVLVSFDDVTVLEQQEIELLKSKEEAEIANQSKSDFLANMSHEIRTPMNAIMGFTEVLRRGYGSGQGSAQHLETIAKNSRHLLELINDILDLSKVESGQIEVEKVPAALHEIILDVIDVLSVSAEAKNITLKFTPFTELPETIEIDPARTRQIITNLIGNAIKFTQEGSVTVTTAVQGSGTKAVIKVAVTDTGIGMSPAQLANIFDPFVQADSSITRRFGGTGLGLTISKKFANAMGGDIVVTSEVGKGSCFTLSLQPGDISQVKRLSAAEMLERKGTSTQKNLGWNMPEANILVVDDSEENRELIKLVLTHQGIAVDQAGDGREALNKISAKRYDMVLMDVQMPVMDGYSAVAELRSTGSELPVYALTAHAMKGIEQKCLEAGFNGYIGKPIIINKLLECVAECIGGHCTGEEVPSIPVLTDVQSDQQPEKAEKDRAPVVSILQNNPKYRPIIQKFVVRLEQQVAEIKEKLATQDFDEVTEIAHKLKGSAGTVGFYSFTQPFHKMEQASKGHDVPAIKKQIAIVEAMYQRIDRTEFDEQFPKAKESST